MPYLYETHLHTDESSVCGRTPAREYIPFYMDHGYDGIVVTDHFYGNPSYVPDKSAPWPEQVNAYCRGWEEAADEGARRGFKVFFGIEQQFANDEALFYGPDKQWLLAHPDARFWTRRQWFEEVSAIGGCAVFAHPFRVRNYVTRITLHPWVHAVEAFNSGNRPEDDVWGFAYGRHYHYPLTAGTDMHCIDRPPALFGVAFDRPWENIFSYAEAVRGKKPFRAVRSPGRGEGTPPPLERPYEYLDRLETPVPWDAGILLEPTPDP